MKLFLCGLLVFSQLARAMDTNGALHAPSKEQSQLLKDRYNSINTLKKSRAFKKQPFKRTVNTVGQPSPEFYAVMAILNQNSL